MQDGRGDKGWGRCVVALVVGVLSVFGGASCKSSDGTTGSGGSSTSTSSAIAVAQGATIGSTSSGQTATSGNSSNGATTSTASGGPTTNSPGCGVTGKPTGDLHLHANDGNGTQRDYEVLVPTSYDPTKPLALTFAYHGAGGNESSSKGFGLQNAPGASDAAIFVFPKGINYKTYGIGWDDSCNGYDMPFFDAMLSQIESDYCIDTSRLYVGGFSWGGDHTTALLCCRGDKIRAAAPSSCTDEFGNSADFTTYQACPVANHAAVRFTHDANGDSAYPNPLFATTSKLFRSFNGCQSSHTATNPSPCESYDGCAEPFVECPYQNLGHALPQGWGNDTWAFLSSFN